MTIAVFSTDLTTTLPHIKNAEEWAHLLSMYLPRYDMTNKKEVAMFIAQTGHESAHYTRLTENLNYSGIALWSLFSNHFESVSEAQKFARKPEKIANRIYANRMGNGDEASGDGWKFRGRGLIQLTGKFNYGKFADFIATPEITTNPQLVAEPKYAVLSAIWFWKYNTCSVLAQRGDVKGVTRIINGGYNGLEDRQKLYEIALSCL